MLDETTLGRLLDKYWSSETEQAMIKALGFLAPPHTPAFREGEGLEMEFTVGHAYERKPQ